MSRILMPEYRPCIAKGKKALFHCWATDYTIQVGKNTFFATSGIVEMEDGRVEKVDTFRIRFVDKKLTEYSFPDEK